MVAPAVQSTLTNQWINQLAQSILSPGVGEYLKMQCKTESKEGYWGHLLWISFFHYRSSSLLALSFMCVLFCWVFTGLHHSSWHCLSPLVDFPLPLPPTLPMCSRSTLSPEEIVNHPVSTAPLKSWWLFLVAPYFVLHNNKLVVTQLSPVGVLWGDGCASSVSYLKMMVVHGFVDNSGMHGCQV